MDPRRRRDRAAPVRRLHARAQRAAAGHQRDRARGPSRPAVGAAREPRRGSGPPTSSATSGCTRSATARSAATRPGCASASSSPRRSSTTRGCSSSTSRRTGSTRPAATRCSSSSGGPAASSGSRSSSPATSSARSSRCATSSSRSTAGGCCAPRRSPSSPTETGVLTVEVEEGRDALAARLGERGLRVLATGGRRPVVQIALDDDRPYDLIRDAVAELGLPLVRIERRRHSLEDLFRDGGPAGRPGRRGRLATVGDAPARGGPPAGAAAEGPDDDDRQHLRHRLPRLRRPAARPPPRRRALARYSTRSVFGIGRSGRAKVLPLICVGLPALIALVLVGVRALAVAERRRRAAGDPRPRRHVQPHRRVPGPVRGRPGARAARARPALPRPHPVLLARAPTDRLRGRQADRPERRRADDRARARRRSSASGRSSSTRTSGRRSGSRSGRCRRSSARRSSSPS